MIIAQISDTHITVNEPESARRAGDLERCVADINRLDPLPDAVIHTGDVTHLGRREEYEKAAAILGALQCPLYVAAGNRDDRRGLRAAFFRDSYLLPDAPFVQYAVEDHPVRLIALDTVNPASNKGEFCQDRLDSLDRALADHRRRPVALFMHHPPFDVTASIYPFQYESREAVSRFEEVLARHGTVVRIFCGHSHRVADGRVGAVPAGTMPSVATDLRLGDYPDHSRATPVYLIHRFDPLRGFLTEARAVSD